MVFIHCQHLQPGGAPGGPAASLSGTVLLHQARDARTHCCLPAGRCAVWNWEVRMDASVWYVCIYINWASVIVCTCAESLEDIIRKTYIRRR